MKWINELAARVNAPREAVIIILVFVAIVIASKVFGG